MMAAIQLFFAGMLLQNLVHKNRQDFELELYRVEDERKRLMGAGEHTT